MVFYICKSITSGNPKVPRPRVGLWRRRYHARMLAKGEVPTIALVGGLRGLDCCAAPLLRIFTRTVMGVAMRQIIDDPQCRVGSEYSGPNGSAGRGSHNMV